MIWILGPKLAALIGFSHKIVSCFVCFLSLTFILDIGDKEATSMAWISGVTLHLPLAIYFSFYSSPPYQLYLFFYSPPYSFSSFVSALFISVVLLLVLLPAPLRELGAGLMERERACVYMDR
jgi:dolichyl-phosphate-mannose--protein O-mannosyl transferase